jgi:hypothetical protein
MKAHRRNGIPTLMLQEGGAPSTRSGGLASGAMVQALRSRDNYEAGLRQQRRQPPMTESQLARDIRRFGQVIDPAIQVPKGISALFNMYMENIGKPFAQYATKQVPSPYAIQQAAEESAQAQAQAQADLATTQAQRAADALSGGVLRPQTTAAPQPPETPAEAAQAEQAAETAEASQDAASVSSTEEEALRQATGAPTQAEEAAATAATPTGTAAEQPIAIEPDDSVTGKLNKVLLGDGAKFDEEERLKQLKKTFGLNLSDMERSAPALAFSFALMGATKEPGESPLQAFIRNAGAAGQSALAQQQALDAKQRSLDAALISPILTERRAAETIERDKEWVTYWDGTTGDGLPNFKSTKMNARQIEEAQKAGIELVPLGLAGSYIAQSAQVQKARKEAEVNLGKAILAQRKDIAEAMRGTVRKSESGRDVRDVVGRIDGSPTTMTFNADPAGRFNNTSAGLSSTSTSMAKVDDMIKAVDQGALNAVGTFNYVIEGAKDYVFGGVGSNINETVSTLRSVGKVSGDLAWNGDNDEEVKSQLKRAMGKGYDQDLSAEQNFRKFFNEKAVFANVTEEDLDRLKGEVNAAKTQEERSLYQARIDYLVNQRSLAASLAPLLLGESGRTISDGDRIRVIELMGGFASGLKVTKPQEASTTLRELKSILGRNAEKLVASLESEVLELETASKTPLYLGTKNEMVFNMTPPVAESLKKAQDALRIYRQIFGQSGGSSADQNAPPSVYAGTASNLKTVK